MYLHEHGIDNFLMLEAKDSLGGRIKSSAFAGKYVPLGATWIHKAEEKHGVWKLAQKYKVKLYKDNYNYGDITFRWE